jgi:geranylgeranyl pyrophosphate synthase
MWQERLLRLLRDEIEAIIAPLSEIAGFSDLIKQSLIHSGQESGSVSIKHELWSLLPLIVYEAISGQYKRALAVAAALQLMKNAAEVLDDIEDADSSTSLSTKYGSAIATNAATTLIILAEKMIARLKKYRVKDQTIIRVMDTINSFYTTTCIGQHLDLSLAPGEEISEDKYLKITYMKSASTAECACCVGALLANPEQKLIKIFSTFGCNLGMASQLANDIQGVLQGSDIIKRKITLPVIFALNQADSHRRNTLKLAFDDSTETIPDITQIKNLLFHTGAINYTTVKMEFYKQLAQDNLADAERGGAKIERLKLFVK